jgi:hypothetical protein
VAARKKNPSDKKRKIENYTHREKKRINNPPVGLVTSQTDRTSASKSTPMTRISIPPFSGPGRPSALRSRSRLSLSTFTSTTGRNECFYWAKKQLSLLTYGNHLVTVTKWLPYSANNVTLSFGR